MDRLGEVIEKMDSNYGSLKELELSNSGLLREKIRLMCLSRQDNLILLDQARSGMVLAKPVLDDSGRVILCQNTELNDSTPQKLKQLGIHQITVKVDPSTAKYEDGRKFPDNIESAKQNEEIIKELDHRFRGLEHNPVMMNIKEVALGCLIAWKAAERKE